MHKLISSDSVKRQYSTMSYKREGCSCWPIFNEKEVQVQEGMHVGKFSIEKGLLIEGGSC